MCSTLVMTLQVNEIGCGFSSDSIINLTLRELSGCVSRVGDMTKPMFAMKSLY